MLQCLVVTAVLGISNGKCWNSFKSCLLTFEVGTVHSCLSFPLKNHCEPLQSCWLLCSEDSGGSHRWEQYSHILCSIWKQSKERAAKKGVAKSEKSHQSNRVKNAALPKSCGEEVLISCLFVWWQHSVEYYLLYLARHSSSRREYINVPLCSVSRMQTSGWVLWQEPFS